MNEEIKSQFEKLMSLIRKEDLLFLFLVYDKETKELHSFKNCAPNGQALLMTHYIEGMPEVDEAFTAQIMHMQQNEAKQVVDEIIKS